MSLLPHTRVPISSFSNWLQRTYNLPTGGDEAAEICLPLQRKYFIYCVLVRLLLHLRLAQTREAVLSCWRRCLQLYDPDPIIRAIPDLELGAISGAAECGSHMRHQNELLSLDDTNEPSSSELYSSEKSAELFPEIERPCPLEQDISDAGMQTQSNEYQDCSHVEIFPSSARSGWGKLAEVSSYIKSKGVSAFGALTYYDQLRKADLFNDYDVISGKLVAEWYTVGASLLGMAALVVTIFGFTPDSVFPLHKCVVQFVAVCSVATGVGLAVDVMLLLKFSSAGGSRFKVLAMGVYSSLVFFAITSRIPLLMLSVSVCSMALFLISMSWSICWQTALCVLTLAATLLLVQYIVFSVRFVIGSIAHFQRRMIRLVHRLTQRLCDRFYFGRWFAESGGGSIYRA